MTAIGRKRLAWCLSVTVVVIIQFTLGPSTHKRDVYPAPIGIPAPVGSIPTGQFPAVSTPSAAVAATGKTRQSPPPAMDNGWSDCRGNDRRSALNFAPGRLDDALPEYLKEYATFHREQMQKVARGDPDASQVRFLIFVCHTRHCGGLGDRFKGIIGGLYLAVVTRRVFIIQHAEPPLSDYLTPHGIDWASWGTCMDDYNDPGAVLLDAVLPPRRGSVKYTAGQEASYDHVNGDLLVTDASNDSVPVYHLVLNTACWDAILDSPAARRNMKRVTGTLWESPGGPRFARAWHLLFRPSSELQRHMAEMRAQLRLPSDGSPWVAAHMRVGLSSEFRDNSRSPIFCSVDQGSKDYAECAASMAGIVSQPPFVRVGGEMDPALVPIFIASDNQEAVERMRVHLTEAGHDDAAVSSTRRQSVHVDYHVSKDYRQERQDFMHTLAELLLLSQATCIALGGLSGYSLVAMLLSQDLATGARCFSANAGYADGVCVVAPLTGPRAVVPGGGMPGMASAKHYVLVGKTFQSIPQCSQVLLKGGFLCRKPLAVDIAFHALVKGRHAIRVKFAILSVYEMQKMIAMLLMVREPCRLDFIFARRGHEREKVEDDVDVVDHYLTITVYVDDRQMQEAVSARARRLAGRLHSFVGMYLATNLSSGYQTSLLSGVNVTMIG